MKNLLSNTSFRFSNDELLSYTDHSGLSPTRLSCRFFSSYPLRLRRSPIILEIGEINKKKLLRNYY